MDLEKLLTGAKAILETAHAEAVERQGAESNVAALVRYSVQDVTAALEVLAYQKRRQAA